MSEANILLVDDEPNVLGSLQRQLSRRYSVTISESGYDALEILKSHGPFAVIVSDMRMAGMNGIQLLKEVKSSYPDTIRIMLTGNGDKDTAIEAVNTGQIFRFFNKPVSSAAMITSLALAVRQHKLLTAEKELLDKSLKGSISLMAELLSLANPTAFSSGYRIKPIVKHIVEELELPNSWQYEVAALMSQIGCITLPSDILQRLQAGLSISDEEQEMYVNHTKIGSGLIKKIPRLEKVAEIIEHQLRRFDSASEADTLEPEVMIGTEILRASIDYDLYRQQEFDHLQAIGLMRKNNVMYNTNIIDILEKQKPQRIQTSVSHLSFKDVVPGMIAGEDVFAKNGTLLVPKNQEISRSILQSLINFKKHIGVQEPICVFTGTHDALEV